MQHAYPVRRSHRIGQAQDGVRRVVQYRSSKQAVTCTAPPRKRGAPDQSYSVTLTLEMWGTLTLEMRSGAWPQEVAYGEHTTKGVARDVSEPTRRVHLLGREDAP